MRTQEQIEDMLNRAYEAYDQNASSFNEAVQITLDWVLGNTDDEPIPDDD